MLVAPLCAQWSGISHTLDDFSATDWMNLPAAVNEGIIRAQAVFFTAFVRRMKDQATRPSSSAAPARRQLPAPIAEPGCIPMAGRKQSCPAFRAERKIAREGGSAGVKLALDHEGPELYLRGARFSWPRSPRSRKYPAICRER